VTRTSESLHGALQAFDAAYARYDEHQRMLETYWALRWLLQENVKEIGGTVLRENLVRLEGLPLTTRVSSLPALNPEIRGPPRDRWNRPDRMQGALPLGVAGPGQGGRKGTPANAVIKCLK
jgi:hypothetical protein